jgi:ribonuclease P protein component
MIGRTHRFHGYGSLRGVYQRGQTVRAPHLSLRYSSRDPKRHYRVAIVVSRKTNKSAVTRNRIRRRIYAVVREADSLIKPGTDLVFTVFSDQLETWEPEKLQKTVAELLQKAASPPAGSH